MKNVTTPLLTDSRAETRPLSGGCANCWAAGYCAAYAPASLLPPTTCPLALTKTGRRSNRNPTRD